MNPQRQTTESTAHEHDSIDQSTNQPRRKINNFNAHPCITIRRTSEQPRPSHPVDPEQTRPC
jgi:hypothetical protein